MAEGEEKPKEKREIFVRIEDLTKEGHQLLQNGDVVNSYLSYEKAVELAQETNEAFTVRACFFNLGACCVAKGEASKGLQFLTRAIPPDEESDGCLNFADLNYNLAVAYDVLAKPSEARRCYKTALEGYRNCSNVEMQGEVLMKLGGTLTSLSLLEEAVVLFHEGENIFHKLEDQRHEVLCLSSRATLLAEMRNEECQELLKTVVDRAEQLQDDLLKAKVYSDVGLVYTSTGQYTKAAEYLDKSLKLIQATKGDQKLEACVFQNFGAVHNQLGSFVKAIIYHEKAIELYGLLGMRYAQGHSFSNLGFAFGQLGELEKSGQYFMHALQAAKDCQDFRGQWQANEGLSAVYFQQKDYEKAVNCLKAALAILPQGHVNDQAIHERIVAKLSNALENQLGNSKPSEIPYKTAVMREKFTAPAVNVDESSPKIGHIRPREKNHKLIARGLALAEHASDVEDDDLSDSTFDSISSYSGSSLSIDQEQQASKQKNTELNVNNPGPSRLTPPVKKDPLNNTYEEPLDIIQVLESGRLRLHDLPRGPRDKVLASMIMNDSSKQEHGQEKTKVVQSSNNTAKSRTCVVQ